MRSMNSKRTGPAKSVRRPRIGRGVLRGILVRCRLRDAASEVVSDVVHERLGGADLRVDGSAGVDSVEQGRVPGDAVGEPARTDDVAGLTGIERLPSRGLGATHLDVP